MMRKIASRRFPVMKYFLLQSHSFCVIKAINCKSEKLQKRRGKSFLAKNIPLVGLVRSSDYCWYTYANRISTLVSHKIKNVA